MTRNEIFEVEAVLVCNCPVCKARRSIDMVDGKPFECGYCETRFISRDGGETLMVIE